MHVTDIALVAGLIFTFALVSKRTQPWPLTMPMVFVGAGALADRLDLIDLTPDVEAVTLLGEATLAVILFSDATRINLISLRRSAGLPGRLLGIGLPLTIFAGGAIAYGLFPSGSLWEAALVGAILAPTDAALGQPVVEDPSVPVRVRQGLNVESGLNDGLALPAVTLFISLSLGEESGARFWAQFLLEQIGLGITVGVLVGGGTAWLMRRALAAGWVEGVFAQLGTLSVGVLAYAVSEWVGGNGFLAAFVAGMVHGTVLGMEIANHLVEYAEDTGRFLAALTFFVFGNVFVVSTFDNLTASIVLCSLLLLTVARMVPVAIAMLGMRSSWQTIVFVGWFGPRGLASMLFGLLLFEEELERAQEVFGVVTLTVVASVVLHGMSASWGARRYGEWFSSMSDEHEEMPEAEDAPEPIVRWASPSSGLFL